jgi:hypothetical protein
MLQSFDESRCPYCGTQTGFPGDEMKILASDKRAQRIELLHQLYQQLKNTNLAGGIAGLSAHARS